jgi:hypothetical protein
MRLHLPFLALIAAALLAVALPPAARADERGRDVETLMSDYTRLWSAKDAHAIWGRIYRLDPGQGFKSEADLSAEFARLTAQGYDHSDLQSVHACLFTPKVALAVLRFSRLKADGTPLPPLNRASAYLLRRFDDGWRVTALLPFSTSTRLDCASTTDP